GVVAIPIPNASGPLAFTPDAQTLIAADIVGGKPFIPLSGPAYTADADLEIRGFDPNTGATRFHDVLERGQKVYSAHLPRDGAIAFFDRPGGTATAWVAATGKRLATIEHYRADYLMEGKLVVVHPPGRPIALVNAATGQRRAFN